MTTRDFRFILQNCTLVSVLNLVFIIKILTQLIVIFHSGILENHQISVKGGKTKE